MDVRRLLALLCLSVFALTACAPTIGVEVAEDATDPDCAPVMLALPDTVGDDLDKAKTNAQATAAWGEPGAAVTLRCGVTPPGPSASCQSVESAQGSVDWIVYQDPDGTAQFTTYGRDPAIEVTVPPAITATRSTSLITDLTEAVDLIPATQECT